MIPWLNSTDPFPPVEAALDDPDGLLCASLELTPQRVLDAYHRGIFPWYSEGQPVLWWSPDPRMVLLPERFRLHRSLRKTLRNTDYEIRVDSAFDQVVGHCAGVRVDSEGTWITPAIRRAYGALHRAGYAHSVETWHAGELVGGLYGIALGRVFFGESMFAHCTDASKIAFAHLVAQLRRWQFRLIDCQQQTAHLASLGAAPIGRAEFVQALLRWTPESACHCITGAPLPTAGPWRFDDDVLAALDASEPCATAQEATA